MERANDRRQTTSSMFRKSIMGKTSMLGRLSIANYHSLEVQNVQIVEGPFLIHPFSTFRSFWVVATFLVLFA